MAEPIKFNFEDQLAEIGELRYVTETEEAEIDRLSDVIAFADVNLIAAIDAAKQNAESKVKAFESKSNAANEARRKSFDIIKRTIGFLTDDLKGKSFTITGKLYARRNPDAPISCVLEPTTIDAPGLDATVLHVGLPLGIDLRGFYLDYFYYTREEHEGINETSGKTYEIPANPAHRQLYHRSQDREFMFDLNPYLVLGMGEEARLAAGIVALDDQRPDTAPILAHLSKVALTPIGR